MARMRAGGLGVLIAVVLLGATAVAARAEAVAPAPAAAAADSDSSLPVLGLSDCVRIALSGSPSLAVADAQRDQAAQGVKQAWGSFLPDVSLSREWQRTSRTDFDLQQTMTVDRPFVTTGGDTLFLPAQVPSGEVADDVVNSSYSGYGAQSSLNLFNGFGKVASVRSAKEELRSAQATVARNRQLVIQGVATAYYDLLRYERLLEVANESRDLAQRQLERSETYFRLGSVAKSDVLQARVRLEQTRLEVVQARNSVDQAFAELAYAMNRPLAARFTVDRSPLSTDFDVAPLESLYQEALAHRPDLESLEHAVQAREHDVTGASANLWPSLTVVARYNRYKNESPYRFGSQESEQFTWGYQVNWAIFDRLQTWTQRSQAKASVRIAEYNLDQARLDAQLEIRTLYNSLVEARERASLARETIIQAQEELRLAQERFRVGAGTSLEQISAEVNLATARAEEVQAVSDFLIAKVRLRVAVGRDLAAAMEDS
jgi:outer membrane protein